MSPAPAPTDAPPAARGSFLTRKLGPLPMYGYLALGAGIIGFVWWRSRSAPASAASDAVTPGATATDNGTPTTDYGQGFDYGYAAGMNATGSAAAAAGSANDGDSDDSPGTIGPISHSRICFRAKDPSGHERKVCALGSWKKGTGGQWNWIPGMPPAHPGQLPTRTIRPPVVIKTPLRHGASGKLAVLGQSVPYPMQ